jgi:hypothetical protein
MARGQGEKPVRGATGDARDRTSNIQGTKHDRGMDSDTSETGSPAGTKIVEKRAKESEKK